MKLIKVLIIVLSIFSLWTACNGEMRVVKGTYVGFWGETTWAFDFNINGTYTLDVEGHAGDFLTQGKFVTAQNLVLLNQDSAYQHVINFDRLIKTPNGCLKDQDGNYYCKNERKRKEAIENAF
ncbi:MAG: hypothetical protein AAF705_22480 [Bacteroidota bacterium]